MRVGIMTDGGDCPGLNAIPFADATKTQKLVGPQEPLVETARALGVVFGD